MVSCSTYRHMIEHIHVGGAVELMIMNNDVARGLSLRRADLRVTIYGSSLVEKMLCHVIYQ